MRLSRKCAGDSKHGTIVRDIFHESNLTATCAQRLPWVLCYPAECNAQSSLSNESPWTPLDDAPRSEGVLRQQGWFVQTTASCAVREMRPLPAMPCLSGFGVSIFPNPVVTL